MRLKIKLGFILIGLILFFAAVTTYLELSRLTTSVQHLIDKGAESITMSNGVLDILQEQNLRLTSQARVDTVIYIERIHPNEMAIIDSLYSQAKLFYPNNKELAAIALVRDEYTKVLDYNSPMTQREFSNWYLNEYNVSYMHFTSAIKMFMLSTQKYVVKETDRFKSSIYRTTMQSLVALSVSIFILFVFFLLIDVYFIRPITQMTKALDRYLNGGISFSVEMEGANEPAQLKDYIKRLIERERKNRQ